MADPLLTDMHVFYWGSVFSQWHKAKFELDDVEFACAEQAMMYLKATKFGDYETADKILSTYHPGEQKSLGRQVKNFDSDIWDAVKYEIVERINYAKFDQNKGLRRKLFQTGYRLLVEASPLDQIWGIGLDAEKAALTSEADWPGQNLLGKIQTQVREQLKEKYRDEWVAVHKG